MVDADPRPPADVVLSARSVTRFFSSRRRTLSLTRPPLIRAVDGVSFDLRRGETLGIVGESGSGKTTLAKLLLALDRPTSGEVLLDGRNIFKLRRTELRRARRDIQIVLQDPYTSLNPRMTAAQLVEEPLNIHGDFVPRKRRSDYVKEMFDLVGLNPDHLGRFPHQFSGGQRQRIGIARALALRPKILICDEPVSALDVSVQAQVINLLARLQRELGLSYIFIGHDLSVVRHVSDRVAVMYLGKVVELGTATEIYESASHPYTQALLSSVPDPSQTRSRRIVLSGEIPSAANPPSGCVFRTRCWKAQDVCAEVEPALMVRDGASQLSACHFATPLGL